ncbi:mapk-regulated corepressor-interacting protein 1 isoform X1 [Hippopotamus amphibius kiboko]|uniref:mapk-regulated corepressor-interacting protein 1 isoform X1 n=2 Tax=Hippopotamus amphibius kiboko TaxID=575201 RepID=UPI002592409B|nr:mapk-regulated corepressor-interacting protein 1 isoform X1 [Hippopotamus amphibius kiboko]
MLLPAPGARPAGPPRLALRRRPACPKLRACEPGGAAPGAGREGPGSWAGSAGLLTIGKHIPILQRLRGPGSRARGPDAPAMTSSPVSRVVYNGKRNSSPRSPPNSSEIFTPAHEENVRFIYEAWQGVERDLRNQMSGSERGLVEEYVEKVPNPSLKTFKPIDLSDLKRRNTQDTKKS